MQRSASCQPFHRCDLASRNLPRCHKARADGLPIQQDGTSSAVARIATHLRSRQPKIVAQYAGEPTRSRRPHLYRMAVHRERNQLHRRQSFGGRHLSGSPRTLPALAAPALTTRRVGSRRWRAHHQSEKESKDVRSSPLRRFPFPPATPPDAFSRSPSRCAFTEQEPTATRASATRPVSSARRTAATIEMEITRYFRAPSFRNAEAACLHAPRYQHRRQNFIRTSRGLAIAHEKLR